MKRWRPDLNVSYPCETYANLRGGQQWWEQGQLSRADDSALAVMLGVLHNTDDPQAACRALLVTMELSQ